MNNLTIIPHKPPDVVAPAGHPGRIRPGLPFYGRCSSR